MTPLRLDDTQVRRFAAATGDANPLHIDPEYARRTPYGRCIAHGALVAMVALGAVDPSILRCARSLSLRFSRPVFPGERLSVRTSSVGQGNVTVQAWSRGQLAAQVAVQAGFAELPPAPAWPRECLGRPRRLTVAELEAEPGAGHGDAYGPDIGALREQARELGAAEVPDALLAWLAAASYTVGMLVPGADGLFVSARIERLGASGPSDHAGPGRIDTVAGRVQPASGLVEVRARFGYAAASASMRLQAFVRTPVPLPRRDVLAGHLPPSDALRGDNVLVVGASRGLGAAVAGALATQGATVWAGYARSSGSAGELRQEFGAEHIRPVRFDAADAAATRTAIEEVTTAAGILAGIVFCAVPPLHDLPLHPEAATAALAYIGQSVAMTLHPLVEALPHIAPGGWLAFVSSSAVADPPVAWPHYVAAKSAVEALAMHCAKHSGLDVVTIRPPRMWTDLTNGPTGALRATATEAVAAAIVRWVLDPHRREALLSPRELG